MLLQLERIMLMLWATGQSSQSFKQQVHGAADKFCADHAEQTDFVAYFRNTWGHKAGERTPSTPVASAL